MYIYILEKDITLSYFFLGGGWARRVTVHNYGSRRSMYVYIYIYAYTWKIFFFGVSVGLLELQGLGSTTQLERDQKHPHESFFCFFCFFWFFMFSRVTGTKFDDSARAWPKTSPWELFHCFGLIWVLYVLWHLPDSFFLFIWVLDVLSELQALRQTTQLERDRQHLIESLFFFGFFFGF